MVNFYKTGILETRKSQRQIKRCANATQCAQKSQVNSEKLILGLVNTEFIIELTGGDQITSIVTNDTVKALRLAEGETVFAIIKASNVMPGVDH